MINTPAENSKARFFSAFEFVLAFKISCSVELSIKRCITSGPEYAVPPIASRLCYDR